MIVSNIDTEDEPVVQIGTPCLRQRAVEVPSGDINSNPLSQLIGQMWATLKVAPGVGLAAPQIDESKRVVVVQDIPETWSHLTSEQVVERERTPIEPYALINPRLTPEGPERRTFFEGCLSVRGYVAAVERFLEVEIEFMDVSGRTCHNRVRGWHARILQHEVDHLDGILYVDRMITRTFCAEKLFPTYGSMPVEDAIRALASPSDG
jgi:peptide deformylase